jgi:hypothetical protein
MMTSDAGSPDLVETPDSGKLRAVLQRQGADDSLDQRDCE